MASRSAHPGVRAARRSTPGAARLGLALAWALLLALACSRESAPTPMHEPGQPSRSVPSGEADLELDASELEPGLLREVRAVHAQVDAADVVSSRHAAVGAIEALLPRLAGNRGSGALWVRQDLYARLCGLQLDLGKPEQALSSCDVGLALSDRTSVPAATAWMHRGKAYELLGNRAKAVESYHRALVMNQELMNQALGDEPPAREGTP